MVAGAVWIATVAAASPADAQSAATRYNRAVAREKAARAAASTPATLRTIARSYEEIVRAFPRSGYSDNALWQAAGLLALAHDRTAARSDLDGAARLLLWLKREYPTSSLAKQVDARIAALRGQPKAPARAAAAPTPAPAAPPPEPDAPVIEDGAAVSTRPLAPLPRAETTAPPSRRPGTTVTNIAHSSLPNGDRLTIELSGEALYSTLRASSPDRVTVEVSDATAAAGLAGRAAAIAGPLVRSVEVAPSAGPSTRIVLQLAGAPRLSTFPLYNPFRLVVDVEAEAPPRAASARDPGVVAAVARRSGIEPPADRVATRPATSEAAPAPVSPASTSRGDYSLARQLGLGVSRIVIDPGHGGHDPGATANGVTEADVVLDVALRLEKLLAAQPGVDVVLTRRTDRFIPLEERTALANRERADMFLSIHVNASPRAATRGIETYLLDFATTPDAEALAARENASSAQTMRLLPEIVKTITLTNKVDESRELAGMVQSSLFRRLAPLSRGVRDLGVKRAPFVVLIGAQMPSVLSEISFLTNRTDASLLRQANHRQRIAQALADAILKYQTSLKAQAAAAAQTATRQSSP
jgi:N-acetylmuramoyl-L-alanine amidase